MDPKLTEKQLSMLKEIDSSENGGIYNYSLDGVVLRSLDKRGLIKKTTYNKAHRSRYKVSLSKEGEETLVRLKITKTKKTTKKKRKIEEDKVDMSEVVKRAARITEKKKPGRKTLERKLFKRKCELEDSLIGFLMDFKVSPCRAFRKSETHLKSAAELEVCSILLEALKDDNFLEVLEMNYSNKCSYFPRGSSQIHNLMHVYSLQSWHKYREMALDEYDIKSLQGKSNEKNGENLLKAG